MDTPSTKRFASDIDLISQPKAPLSLYGIARRYCREEILVQPLSWTGRHLELLQCSFSELSPASPTTQSNYTGEKSGVRFVQAHVKHYGHYHSRSSAIRSLLTAPECPLNCRENLYLYLNRRPVKRLSCYYFHLRNPGSELAALESKQPIAAYVDRERIHFKRGETLRRYTARRSNGPVNAIWLKKWKQIDPTEPLHDPYIVALLIAMAQQQRIILRRTKPNQKTPVTIFQSRVLSSFATKEGIHLYTADIPSSVLEMFDYPTLPPPSAPSISVQITMIPFEPYDTFRGRLLTLMLPKAPNSLMKRKRELDVK